MVRRTCGAPLADNSVALSGNNLLSEVMRVRGRKSNRSKPFIFQNVSPGVRVQPGTARYAKLGVFVQPPTFQQPESKMKKQRVGTQLIEHTQASSTQRCLRIAYGVANITRCMQRIRSNYNIVAGLRNGLARQGIFDIKS